MGLSCKWIRQSRLASDRFLKPFFLLLLLFRFTQKKREKMKKDDNEDVEADNDAYADIYHYSGLTGNK